MVLVQNFELKTDFRDLTFHAYSYLKSVIIITVNLHSTVKFTGIAHLYDQSPQGIRHVMLLGKIVSIYLTHCSLF